MASRRSKDGRIRKLNAYTRRQNNLPLSPALRRERREQEAKMREPKKFPRKRCQNCGGFMTITTARAHRTKKFCKRSCKDEFHNHGSAFGPLKVTLENLVTRWLKDHRKEVNRRLDAIEERITVMERDAEDFDARLIQLRQDVSRFLVSITTKQSAEEDIPTDFDYSAGGADSGGKRVIFGSNKARGHQAS